MKLKSGRGFKERLHARRDRRMNRLAEGTKPRTGVARGPERYGGQSGSKTSAPPPF
jgi:hypothetical protein